MKTRNLLLLTVGFFACSATKEVARVVQVQSEVIAFAEPCLVEEYKREQEQCLTLPEKAAAVACVNDVRKRWQSVADSLGGLRKLRCGVEPKKCHPGEGSTP